MNFRLNLTILVISISFLYSKSILREINQNQIIINKKNSQNRSSEEIINIDFENDVSGWTQDSSYGWELTETSSNSPTHSYNSPDQNNSGSFSAHSLYSEEINLPNLVDGEAIQYSFALNCDMPDFSQEDNPNTPANESEYLADYYTISIRDIDESAWHISDFNNTDGNNWWCGDEDIGGYLDGWIQYLDTPAFTVPENTQLTADMKWGIENPDGAEGDVPNTCATAGWDQANVQISIDNGATWNILNGSTPYDFECGYATIYNGFDPAPGWGGVQNWHNVSFDLSEYSGETALIRFAFYSDPAYSTIDDNLLTGYQVDNIIISGILNDTADDENSMEPSGEAWIEQFYDYCESERPGFLNWETYNPGDAWNGNVLMDLTSFSGKNIQFRFQTLYDGNHYSSEAENPQGEGLYIDDLIIYKESTFNPIPPEGLTGYLNNNNVYILWDDLNVSGTGDFIYDNGIFTPDHFIVIDESSTEDAWAGTEIYNAGTSVVDSIYIYVFGAFEGKIAGFSSFGSDYNVIPDYEEDLQVLLLNDELQLDLSEHTWVGIDVNNWTFYGSFIIGQTLSENYPIGYDPTAAPSSHSKIFLGSNWENWIDVISDLDDNQIVDGEWGIRTKMTYSSPEATYNVYRDGILIQSGLQDFAYTDTGIESGNTYTYNVSATYLNGDESVLSEDFIITIEECELDEPGCDCDSCESNNCIYDCTLNCVDFYNSEGELFYLSYINDNNCDDGEENEFSLNCEEFLHDGLDCIVDLSIEDNSIPKIFSLGQNNPNPFNPITSIPFSIPELSNIELKIYNILGQEIYKKSYKNLTPGNYNHYWDASLLNSGVYFYTLQSDSGILLKEKMLLIK